MKNGKLLAVFALSVLLPSALFGQAQTTGTVTGTLLNEAGQPVPDAEVTITGAAIGERTMRTNVSGNFTAALLPPGEYTATFTKAGLQPSVVTFRVLLGQTQRIDVTLAPGEVVSETIVVHGRTTALETTETRATFNYTDEVEQLPITNRNINIVALNAPNTSLGPNTGQVAIAGAPAFDTVVLLDGAEISDPYFGSGTTVYLEDAVQEVQVMTTGIGARYGRFQGGVINAVTKTGGNEFSGTIRGEFDNPSKNSASPYGETLSDTTNEKYQATLGGYILRDRLWFFGGYRKIPSTATPTTTRTTGHTFNQISAEDRQQLKLRGAITPNHAIDASYLEFEATTASYAGLPPGELQAGTGVRGDPRTMFSAAYQGIFGSSTFAEAMYTQKDVSILSGGNPDGGDPFIWITPGNWVYNNHWWDATDPSVRDNRTASVNLNHNLATARFGSHNLQAGLQRVESMTAGDNRQSATGYNLVGLTQNFNPRVSGGDVIFDLLPGEAQRWVATNLRATNTVENTAVYLQDTIDLNRMRVDLGVRYEQYRGTTTGVDAFDLNFTTLAPRLGLTYNVTPGLQLVGTWGRYYGRFNDSWGEDASGAGSAPREEYLYSGAPIIGGTRAQLQAALRNNALWTLSGLIGDPNFPATYVASDIESPYNDELNLSVRAGLPRNSGFVSLTYTDRAYHNLIDDFVGLACTDFGLCDGGGDYSPLPNNQRTDTTVIDNDGRAKRDYTALALQVDYRPSSRLTTGGQWTWSETKGNYEGEAANQPSSGSVLGNRERDFPLQFAAPFGYLNPHIRHRANAYATYRFDLGRLGDLSTSVMGHYRTGRVWSRSAAVPRATTPAYASRPSATYVHFFDGRGENEFNAVWNLDAAVRYALPIFRGIAPFLKLAVENVTDNDTLISFQTTGSSRVVGGVREWVPAGIPADQLSTSPCNPANSNFEPSRNCASFGRITGPINYQIPRTFLLSAGIQF